MNRLIEAKRDEIFRLCRRCGVRRLEVFGSAVAGCFDLQTSDLDFLVEFFPMEPTEHADGYFGLLEGLQDLFERDIDLVENGAIANPYFLKSVDQSRAVVYAA